MTETWDEMNFTDNLWDGDHTLIFIANILGVITQNIKMTFFFVFNFILKREVEKFWYLLGILQRSLLVCILL